VPPENNNITIGKTGTPKKGEIKDPIPREGKIPIAHKRE
jgi:hypothetical protein